MRAHWLGDGEQVLVTGTQDVDAALAHLDTYEPDMFEMATECGGTAVRGSIIPADKSTREITGWGFLWHQGHGKDGGRVKAVIFG